MISKNQKIKDVSDLGDLSIKTRKYKIKIISWKFYIVMFFFIILLAVFIFRLFSLQVIKSDYYNILANRQYTSAESDIFDRGNIYFNKSNQVGEYEKILAAGIKEDIIKKNNIDIVKRYRYYNYDEVGAKVLGFVGWSSDKRVGQYGIEQQYNDILTRDQNNVTKNFFLDLYDSLYEYKKQDGVINDFGDIYLTLNPDVSIMLNETLHDIKDKWQSDNVGAIIMNPKTGEIIAMDELESFNPNNIASTTHIKNFNNTLISGVYEMGSIIKPLTMLAAMDSGVVNINTTYNDTSFRELDGYKVYNHDKAGRGVIGMYPILADSLNVGIIFLVEKMGIETFTSYFKKFGIGFETGISLPGESSGLVANLDSNIMVDAGTAGFGQGIAISPVQTIRALSVVANGGKLVTPQIVKKIVYSNGYTKDFVPDESVRVASEESAKIVKDYMVKIVDLKLSDGQYKDLKYSVAAKTGTAQIPQPGGGYYKDRYLHSFIGFFPAEDPKFIVFLFHTYPKGADYASKTLTESFFKIKNYLINYYSVLPDR